MDKYIGRLLDNRYEILEVIGTGGMAVVYKARCHRLNRFVAIKILKDDYLQDEEFRRRFHAESQAVAMLSHPNIVAVYDVSTSVSADYIVMELIDGISLKQYMETKGVLNWKETLHFGIQIAKALEHAHSRGIVHRDIKPHNVMVLKNGSVKVTDFGIARMMAKSHTLTREALGSVHYISPEQAKGGRVDSRSDLYSLGVVMYEMMTGRPPYDGESPVSVAIQHINGGAPMPSTLNPNIPGGLEQIIMKAMAHEIGERYESATEMLRDADAFRQNPAMLFDYNTPPLDAVIRLPRQPLVLDPPAPRPEAKPGERRRPQTQGKKPAPENRRRRSNWEEAESGNRIATIAIISCFVVALLAIGIFLLVFFQDSGGTIKVPDFTGMTVEEAIAAGYKIKIKTQSTEYHTTLAPGKIISQRPLSETYIAEGETIFVVVSKGPAPITMDDLTEMSETRARNQLEKLQLDLNIKVKQEHHTTVQVGNVTRTEPGQGTQLQHGQTVTLYVSIGPETKTATMIDAKNKTENFIRTYLENLDLNLSISVIRESNNDVPKDHVIAFEPAAGKELAAGDEVILHVSTGPVKVKMPPLVGLSVGAASDLLVNYGFPIPEIELVENSAPSGEVIGQSVVEGATVTVTTKIKLTVSKGSENHTQDPTDPSPVITTKIVEISMPPERQGTAKLSILLGDTVIKEVDVPEEKNTVSIELSGSGQVEYTIRLNGADYMTKKVDFAQ